MSGCPVSVFMPVLGGLTRNERAWVGFLRLVAVDTDPVPTLARVQALRLALSAERKEACRPGSRTGS